MHILVVDDEPDVRKVVASMFRHIGHEVTEAQDGEEGVTKFLQDPTIRGVFSDLHMPRKRGDEMHRSIKESLVDRRGSFVLVSGDCPPDVKAYFASHQIPCVRKGSEVHFNFLATLFQD